MTDCQRKVLKLLDEQGRSLHGLLARLTRCEEATSDLMQELFIRLVRSRGFEKARDPHAFAWRTAANLAFEWRRRRRVASAVFGKRGLSDASCPTPLRQLIEAERLEGVLEATGKLSRLGRNVVVMRFIEEASYDEIGLRLGKNPNHVRVLCSKSIRKLRRMLDGQDRVGAEAEVSYE